MSKPSPAKSPASLPGDSPVPLESILCTEELDRRPRRAPDYETENRALARLVQALADSPGSILQTLADTILEVLQADSAGISLLSTHDGGKRFYWPAIAGAWKPHIGGGTPRDFGPCGDVLDHNAPLLFKHFERRYPYLLPATPAAEEALLIPFYVHGEPVGTIWAMAHDDRRRFDAEDLRLLESLGRFTSAAYQAMHLQQGESASERSRRAALNLMEDAVHARRTVEKLNAEIRESEERYRNLFNSMDQGYCIIEMIFDEHEQPVDYRFLEVNSAFEKQAGMHEVIGKRMLEFVPHIEAHWLENYGNVALTGEPIRFADEYKELGGRWFDVYAFRVGGEDGRRVAVLFDNIKDRKETDRALRESEERLRTLTEQLADESRRKDEFLAALGHELRNPLAPIRSGLDLMRMTQHDPVTLEETRRTMERQVDQLVRLLDDLLDVSRITRSKLDLRLGRVELADVLREAVAATRPFIDEADHELTVTLPPTAIVLHADGQRLVQIFSNLLNNAAKYTPEGGHVRLSAERQGNDVLVTVEDTGIGISDAMQDRIFEMFSQGDRFPHTQPPGLGIGLTIVKQLVEMHGGTVAARSEGPDRGSAFHVRLPVPASEDVAEETEDVDGAERTHGATANHAARLRILVVDDHEDAAEMLSIVVERLGNEVRTAFNGQRAIEIAAEFLPDVVFMDLGMPGMNGHDAARHLRDQPWGEKMVLVALTGWGQDRDREHTKQTGFDHHLVKPVETATLRELIADIGVELAEAE